MRDWQGVCTDISAATGQPFTLQSTRSIGGGCINDATLFEGNGQQYFVKTNRPALLDMFAAEGEALAEMNASQTIRVPRPVCWGSDDRRAWLVMEYLPLGSGGSQSLLGRQLAAMHRVTKGAFGWHRDNTIGSTPQVNGWHDDWIEFYAQRRLAYQLELAASKGYGGRLQQLGERLLPLVADFFVGYSPLASMLHGDLWAGNYSFTASGEPVIFDPALYYGDREADLAMTELFGGFGTEFRHAYVEAWPLDSGYTVRKTLYNLYHVINHLNLFGGGYGRQAEGMIQQLLSERS